MNIKPAALPTSASPAFEDTPALDEKALVAGLKRGDPQAFHTAVRRFSGAMMAAAQSMTDRATAEDVVQDAWLTVIKAIQRFEERSSLKTWLTTIAANGARNRLRKSNRELVMDFSENPESPLAGRFNEAGHWQNPTLRWSDASADRLLESQALQTCLDAHIARLPETQRTILILRDMQGLEADEICNILDISASNLRVALHRARQRIFSMVEHYQETGNC